nr:hypothetical protein [Halobacterium sp. CBA1126]
MSEAIASPMASHAAANSATWSAAAATPTASVNAKRPREELVDAGVPGHVAAGERVDDAAEERDDRPHDDREPVDDEVAGQRPLGAGADRERDRGQTEHEQRPDRPRRGSPHRRARRGGFRELYRVVGAWVVSHRSWVRHRSAPRAAVEAGRGNRGDVLYSITRTYWLL